MKRSAVVFLLGIGIVGGQAFAASAPESAIVSELKDVSGILTVQYGDYAPGSGIPSRRLVTLHADTGEVLLLEAVGGASLLPKGAHSYQGKRVTVTGRMRSDPGLAQPATAHRRFVVTTEVQVRNPASTDVAFSKYSDPTPVARPFVSLLCKFADDPAEPQPIAYFTTQLNNTYPGFDHYVREASYGKTTLAGSNAFGWFTLPQPRSFYVPTSPTNEQSQQMLTNLAQACSAVARATVNFTPFFGINFMFNGALDGAAWGGSSVLDLTAEGSKAWPSTWMPFTGSGADRFGWNTHNILAHEISHAFGAPHSQTPEGNEYGNSWDVVSAPGDNCTAAFTDAAYGCIGQSMNAYAKSTMDFLPDNRLVTYVLGSGPQTYQLERLAQAPANTNPLMVRIPIAGSTTRFYTVEARSRLGYDQKLRTDGVIIHEVDTTRDRQAQVVPMDSGDAGRLGAAWAVGRVFLSSSENIMIQVVAATPSGYTVSVGPVPAGTISLAVSRTGSGAGSVSSSPAGIDCGTTCNSGFNAATVVTLTATASAGSTFRGWSGICSGTSTCTVTLDAAKRVTATFSAVDAVSSNLAVYLAGTGTGTVTSNPFGINCGPVCSWDSDPSSAAVTLVATPTSGAVFAGWTGACTGTGNCTVTAAASRSITATFIAASNLSPSPATLAFGGQSMNTTSPAMAVTLSNATAGAVTVTSVAVSTYFTVSHNCSSVVVGASCTANVTFTPTAQGSLTGTLTVATSAGTLTVALSGTGERSLVTHYYRSILRRAPDTGGKSYWEAEATRVQALGVNVNEVWFAMAGSFYFSTEYLALNRDNSGFVTDLYGTFFNRAPDTGGFNDWMAQLTAGMPREVVLASFMFSTEFATFTQAIFGPATTRKEIDTVVDFFRGLLARLPDDGGFAFWLQKFRAAQCLGGAAVNAEVESISSQFAQGTEYAARNRSNSQYVGDLYNAFLRRGGDLGGVQFWIGQVTTGAQTREAVRIQFVASPEFNARVNAIIAQGCLP